jgi:hypothetical protein
VTQLGDPVVLTPNVPVFDFATGRTADVAVLQGGNPLLVADNRRVFKLGLTFKPWEETDLSLTANYLRTRIDDPIAGFPTITPEIEAAFPDRFLRDAEGSLVQIDSRPVNFARSDREEFRWGLNWSKRLGPPASAAGQPAPPAAAEGRRERREGAGPGGGGGRGGFGGGRFAGRPGESRMQLAAYHTWRLKDSILIREGRARTRPAGRLGRGAPPAAFRARTRPPGRRLSQRAWAPARGRLAQRHDGPRRRRAGSTGDLTFEPFSTATCASSPTSASGARWSKTTPGSGARGVSLAVTNVFDSRLEVRDATGLIPHHLRSRPHRPRRPRRPPQRPQALPPPLPTARGRQPRMSGALISAGQT